MLMSRSDLVAGLGRIRARVSPYTQGKERAVETGISGRCWLRLSFGVFETRAAAIPGDRTQRVWGRLLAVLEAGAPSATAQPGAGGRRVSKCPKEERGKKKKKHPSPDPSKNHFCYNFVFHACLLLKLGMFLWAWGSHVSGRVKKRK